MERGVLSYQYEPSSKPGAAGGAGHVQRRELRSQGNANPDPNPNPNPSQVRVPTGCRFEMLGTSSSGRAARGGKTAPPSSREWAPGKLCVADTSFVHRTRNDHASESRYVQCS